MPVDGILVDSSDNKYAKTSTCLLTGESYVHYIEKIDKSKKIGDYNKDYHLKIKNYYPKDLHNIEATLSNNIVKKKINGANFVVSGSIVISEEIYLWVIGCGKTKKSNCNIEPSIAKKSYLDKYIANYMTKVNLPLLIMLVLFTTLYKIYHTNPGENLSNYLYSFCLYLIQNWILFNGIIPFSVKILLLLTRNVQSIIFSKKNNIKINNALFIDEIGNIDKIVSDKTGTLTNNELEFSLIGYYNSKNNGYHIREIMDNDNENVNVELIKCLGLCIHIQPDNTYSTIEDKIIRYRYEYLNSNITQTDDNITLEIGNNMYQYKYVEIAGIDFSYTRKMSSKIVKTSDNKYYIYCKGALDIIKQKISNNDKIILEELDRLITIKNPSLRLLACAYREVSEEEIEFILTKTNQY